jgi:CubicO group peptidase (beta-lactamase class C family)
VKTRARFLVLPLLVLSGARPYASAEPPAVEPKQAPAAKSAPPRDVTALLGPIRARNDLPALAGAIVVGSRLEAAGCDGVRRRGSPEKVTLEDRWHLGSCTKAMTATLCAMLVEEKKLAWDTTLAKAFPEHAKAEKRMDAGWKGVTLEQLLTHRAGMPSDLSTDGLWGKLWQRQGTPAEQRMQLVDGVLAHAPIHPPGTKGAYSNAGVAFAGVLAERAAEQEYEALITKRLFEPLGITSAGFGAPGTPDKNDGRPAGARGHGADGKPVEPGPSSDNPPGIAPAGTVHMTIGDWGKFVALHLDGRAGRSRLLPKAAFERLHTPPKGAEPPFACGWVVLERPWGGTVLTHSGSNTMWFCVVWMSPSKDFAVLACTNTAGAAAEKACDETAWALIQDYLAAAR